MEKFVSNWSNSKSNFPENYIFPPGKRPGKNVVPISKTIPVIDLGKVEGNDHTKIVYHIMEAAHEYGFFQVINHGVPIRLMDDAREVFKDFFELPMEEKSQYLSLDVNKKFIHFTSNVDYDREEFHNWRDSIRHCCTPLEECIQHWPQKPPNYREIVGEYTTKVRELGSRILEMICEGLGLEPGYFAKELSEEQLLAVHKYPICPDPTLTLGTRQHCDTGLLTILLQGNVYGLQVLKDDQWIGVEPIPDAFVVNLGYPLQIVSNGKLVAVEHRAVTNKEKSRITAAFFIQPTKDCLLQPANSLLNQHNPPIYKTFLFSDFLKSFRAAYVGEIDHVLDPFTI